jgi:hypothetical protein
LRPGRKAASDAARLLAQLGSRKGGKASAAALTPEERKARARDAGAKRWAAEKGDELPIDQKAVMKRLSGADKVTLRIAPGGGGKRRRGAIEALVAKKAIVVLADLKDQITIAPGPTNLKA